MTTPLVSLLLCTVRPSHAYANHPEWDCIGKVVEDLCHQVDAPPFELVIVDGIYGHRKLDEILAPLAVRYGARFSIRHLPSRPGSPWVRMHKVAICAYRNTGIAAARGELIVNLDDCCVLPANYVATFWRAWNERHVALGMLWPKRGDSRPQGFVGEPGGPLPGQVFGFGSYPRSMAMEINGYDEAYDGGQGLEDGDWSLRLYQAGLKQALVHLPGFDIEEQTGHEPRAIDPERKVVKCVNQAWQAERVQRNVVVANRAELWTRETLRSLVGPCPHLHGEKCGHHADQYRCAWFDQGMATGLDPEAAVVFDEPPVLDMMKLEEEYR